MFLLEEPSAKAMLESLLPRMLKEDTRFRCIPFEGKQDLEKQLTRRIRAYQNERARFIVLRDQDSHPDCTAVKQGLLDLCDKSGKFARCLVRIACRARGFLSGRSAGCRTSPRDRRIDSASEQQEVPVPGRTRQPQPRVENLDTQSLRKGRGVSGNRQTPATRQCPLRELS